MNLGRYLLSYFGFMLIPGPLTIFLYVAGFINVFIFLLLLLVASIFWYVLIGTHGVGQEEADEGLDNILDAIFGSIFWWRN